MTERLFGIDPRSLALFRVALGFLLLVDLGTRAGDLGAMYTDAGAFPRSLVRSHYTDPWNWSLHFASGGPAFQAALFIVAAALALALAAGWRTRAVTIASWLLLVSLQNRVPPILSASDNLLRMLVFWAMFLPLGRAWSLDARHRGNGGGTAPAARTPVVGVATAAVLLQMALVYLVSAAWKTNGDWLGGGAIAGALAHDLYAKPAGAGLLGHPGLLGAATIAVFLLEWAAPFLLFSPVGTARVRTATVAALASMHLGIELCLAVGLFSWVTVAGLTLFLPGALWDRARRRPPTPRPAPGTARRPARAATAACAVALAYVVAVNIDSLPGQPLRPLALQRWGPLWSGAGLGQRWNMFDQAPSRDGWFVLAGRLADGSDVDLLRGGVQLDFARPEYPALGFDNHRWRKLFREMSYRDGAGFHQFREPVCHYLGRGWNRGNPPPKNLVYLDLLFCTEIPDTGGDPPSPPVRAERLLLLDLRDTGVDKPGHP